MGGFSLFLVRQLRRRKFPVSPEAGTRPKFREDCGASPSVPLAGDSCAGLAGRARGGTGRTLPCPGAAALALRGAAC